MRMLTAYVAVDHLARGWSARRAARAAIAEANTLASAGTRLNVVVLAKDGTHAAASSRTGVRYAFMTAEMDEPRIAPRLVVPRRGR
jgi:isoaspartyl peptidase/L-asparaginase-like protein (Ntn-hydrolase superfamily)